MINLSGFFVGIDGGGTKSDCIVLFENDRPPVRIAGGPINICSNPAETVEKNFAALFDRVCRQCGELSHCLGVCVGAAGFSNPSTKPFLTRQATFFAPTAAISITSDAFVALYGALRADEGIILVSGTGSVCFGAKKGRTHQAGGCGHLLDDEGSGYAIGRDILVSVLKAWDGRSKHTILCELVREKYGFINASDIITFVYGGATGKKDIAGIAPMLTEGCLAKDETCLSIADKAAKNLVELVSAVAGALSLWDARLAISGSMITKEPNVRGSFTRLLSKTHQNLSVHQPAGAFAAEGAALLAKEAAAKR